MRIDWLCLEGVGPFTKRTFVKFPKAQDDDPKLADVYLLVGPNGSGKSTIIQALAALVGVPTRALRAPSLEPRMHSNGVASIAAAGVELAIAESWKSPGQRREAIAVVAPSGQKFSIPHAHDLGILSFFAPMAFMHAGWPLASGLSVAKTSRDVRLNWAPFAYAGHRSVGNVSVAAIQEPSSSPLEGVLDLEKAGAAAAVALWVANQDFKRLKAKEAGKQEQAESYARTRLAIERLVGEIAGADFSFAISDADNNVRISFAGVVQEFDVLPDGVKSILSWLADLLMRLDRIPWENDTPIHERSFLLLLDEIDVHLHPAWQRKVLPAIQRAFPNAQIIATTHSPFVVASVADGYVIPCDVKNGEATVGEPKRARLGMSYSAVLRSIFGITSEFDEDTERQFQRLADAKARFLRGEVAAQADIDDAIRVLSQRGEEVAHLVALEQRQFERQRRQAGAA